MGNVPALYRQDETASTQVWLEEYKWLVRVQKSPENCAPTFRLPDLLAACVSILFEQEAPGELIFAFLRRELVQRSRTTERRRVDLWRPQWNFLYALQTSAINQHPNPMFHLDMLTTACVALVRQGDADGEKVLHCARRNLAARAQSDREAKLVL